MYSYSCVPVTFTYAHSQVADTGATAIYNATLQSAFSVLCPLPDVDELFDDLGVNQLRFKYVLHSCCSRTSVHSGFL